MFKFSALAVAAATLAIATPVVAQNDVATVSIDIDDLDLATEKDQRRMETRIDSAIRKLCELRGPQPSHIRALVAQCRTEALASASPQADRAIAAAQRSTRIASLKIGRGA